MMTQTQDDKANSTIVVQEDDVVQAAKPMGFEREYGRRATRRRRYYNGRIECEYRIFE